MYPLINREAKWVRDQEKANEEESSTPMRPLINLEAKWVRDQMIDQEKANEEESSTPMYPLINLEAKWVRDQEKANEKTSSTLPAKHFKNLSFGYWMIMKMKNDSLITDETFEVMMKDYLKVYSSVSEQITYYEAFDTDCKMVTKDLKKLIKDFHKPPKVKKEKKTKKVSDDTDKPKKRGRPSKKNLQTEENDDDLVSRIVTAAFDNIDKSEPRVYERASKDKEEPKVEVTTPKVKKATTPKVKKSTTPKVKKSTIDKVQEKVEEKVQEKV